MTCAILINVGALFLERVPQSQDLGVALDWIEAICLWFFTIDIVIRVSSIGFSAFLRDNWNKLDMIIVCTSWLSRGSELSAFSALRAVRVLRVVLLMKNLDTMRPIIRALLLSIPPCINVVGLVLLILFVFSVLAMNLFGLRGHGEFVSFVTFHRPQHIDLLKNGFVVY
eukprot:SAG11_NODE_394_length_9826_cov_3.333607_6_plen_169_part_00